MALTVLVNKIMKKLDDGDIVFGLFLDLCKAFNTANHKILFNEMQKYGIRGMSLKWFENYLCSRSQFLNFNNHKLTEKLILEYLIAHFQDLKAQFRTSPFLLYVNDLSKISEKLFQLLFTSVLCQVNLLIQ